MNAGMQIEPLIKLGAELFFYIALLAFIIHLLVLAFHWFSYGASQKQNASALFIYVVGGAILLLFLYTITINL
jgi:hypothetical protein